MKARIEMPVHLQEYCSLVVVSDSGERGIEHEGVVDIVRLVVIVAAHHVAWLESGMFL